MDCGRAGPRERSLFGTPSLNPGLWYYWYPPNASRRQAKKTRTALTRITGTVSRAPKRLVLLGLTSIYGVSRRLDVTQSQESFGEYD